MKSQTSVRQCNFGQWLLKLSPVVALVMGLSTGRIVDAADQSVIEIVIKDYTFMPAQIRIPAGKPAVLHIRNQDDSAEEFESHSLKIEKIVTGGGEILVRLRPLPPGQYRFFGEYNPSTAQGVVIVE